MTTLQEAARLEDPVFYNIEDPYPTYERLRHEAPVFWYERDGVGFWALSRWDDIREVSAKPELFSTEHGLLSGDPRALREHGQLLSEGTSPPGADNILATDPPTHTNLRKLVSKVFTPRMIAKLESRVRELVQESFEQIVPGEPFDFVEALAVPLPMY